MSQLFEDLPVQPVPLRLYSDQHVLEPCPTCTGTGVNPEWPGDDEPAWWRDWFDPKCSACAGGGKRLLFVGPAVDVGNG